MSISVLCVDDDPELLELAKAFLEEQERLEVDTVTSAHEALQMLRKRRYEAVVSDYQMPSMDGIEFLKQFRSFDPSTPFIIFTGRGREEVAIEALNSGASFYLQKGGEARSQFALLEHKILSAVEKRKAEERVRVLGRLYQVTFATNRSILQARSEGELLRSITDLAVSLGEFRMAWIGIFEDNGRVVHPSFSSAPEVVVPESTGKGPPPKFAASVRSQVRRAMTSGAVVCNNVRTDLPASDWKGFMEKTSCSSFAILPIQSSSKPIGALVLCSGDEGSFNGEVIELMREMTNDISFALENLEARARIDKLVAGLRQSNTKLEALYRVAHAANSTKHLDDFYRSIHSILLELMPAKNFFIALWDQEKGEVSYPYFVDEFDAPPPLGNVGKGLTAHVLLTGRSLLAPPDVFDELMRRGEVESLGTPSVDWLGVPLRRGDCVIGAMVTQSYAEGVHLGENERQIMEFISDHVAMAIERKKAEEAMRESEERYASLFDRTIDLVYIQDFQGNILDANPAALKAFGYSLEEAKALNIMNLVPQAQLPGAYDALKVVTKTGSLPHFLEFDLKRKDGTYITVEVSSSLLYHEGKPYAIQGVARDISDRRAAEEALRQSDERFQLANRATFNAIWDWNLQTNAIWWNENFQTLFGYRAEEIEETIESWTNRIHPEDLDRVTIGIHAAIDSGRQYWSDQYRFRRKDGTYAEIDDRGYVVREASGKPMRMIGAMQDITERKRAEGDLAASKALLSEAEKMGKIGGWTFDVETMTQTWTEETFRILEIDLTNSEPMVPEGIGFIAPAFRPMAEQAIQRAIEFGEPYDQEWEIITAKGNKRWVHAVAVAHQEQGKTKNVSGYFQDITERKQVENALQGSEKRYRLVVESAAEVILVLQDGMIRLVNPIAVAMTGFSEQEIKSKPFPSFIHPDDRAMVVERHQRRLRGEVVPPRYDFRLLAKDGSIKWVEISAVLIDWEGRPATLNFLTDITERKQAEEALRESEDKFRVISENSPDHIIVQDRDLRYVWAINPQLGLTLPDMIGKTDQAFLTKEDADKLTSVKTEVMRSGKEIRLSTSLPSLGGSREYFDEVFVPRFDSKGRNDGIIGYFRNVTETMRAQEALREATKKLHILNGITRHDILNQLVTLAGFLELHKRSLGEQASYPYLARVERSIEVIREQVEFTGDYEAMGSSSPEWHSVAKLVRGVPQSNIERVEIGEMAEKLTILADPMLPKVFGNLLLNSLKHGGKVTKVMVDCRETEGGIILSYADDGVGIPMEEKERIFDKGFGKGTGLGLFFSKEVLGITGITIKENGEPGKGARFEMFVPQGSYALADPE